jgi:hypothetical protein
MSPYHQSHNGDKRTRPHGHHIIGSHALKGHYRNMQWHWRKISVCHHINPTNIILHYDCFKCNYCPTAWYTAPHINMSPYHHSHNGDKRTMPHGHHIIGSNALEGHYRNMQWHWRKISVCHHITSHIIGIREPCRMDITLSEVMPWRATIEICSGIGEKYQYVTISPLT